MRVALNRMEVVLGLDLFVSHLAVPISAVRSRIPPWQRATIGPDKRRTVLRRTRSGFGRHLATPSLAKLASHRNAWVRLAQADGTSRNETWNPSMSSLSAAIVKLS